MNNINNLLLLLIGVFLSLLTSNCNKPAAQQYISQAKDSIVPRSTPPIDTINKVKPDSTNTPTDTIISDNTNNDLMKFEIVFENVPSIAEVSPAPLKFNKYGWASVEWDDNSTASLDALPVLSSHYFTDGCGNNIHYTGAVAVNGRNNYANDEVALLPNNISYADMKNLIASDWDIENHSYYHEPNGNYNYGYDWDRNVKELDQLILNRIRYKINGAVVPTNYSGFPTAAKNFGYLFSTSQGTFDDLLPAGKPTYQDVNDFSIAPKTFSSYGRMFYDNWGDMENAVKKAIDVIVTKSNNYFRFASHGINRDAFIRIIDYFTTKTTDKILFIPTREIMEYRIMAALPIKYDKIINKIVVSIPTTTVSANIRWRDLSFIVKSDQKIKTINLIAGIDKFSCNNSTGLVNIFKQKTNW